MYIKNLKFNNYRNIKREEIEPVKGINIIYGDNAQGKTNVLEAIWLFTGGKSFRGSKDKELISFLDDSVSYAEISINFFAAQREQESVIKIEKEYKSKRTASLNGVYKGLASNLIGSFCSTVFSPHNLLMIKEGPSVRRKFIDAAICQIKPAYTKTIINYNKILKNRNTLIRDLNHNKVLDDTIDIWENRLAYFGSKIIINRIAYCNSLEEFAYDIYSGISRSQEDLFIEYKQSINLENNLKREDIELNLREALKQRRNSDIHSGFTSVGPHRDDIIIDINNKSAKLFGSQGQQRSAVLALKLSEALILEQNTSEKPVILLDDVMSELDPYRQDYLLNHIDDFQVFITCCDKNSFSGLLEGKPFHIKNGSFLEK